MFFFRFDPDGSGTDRRQAPDAAGAKTPRDQVLQDQRRKVSLPHRCGVLRFCILSHRTDLSFVCLERLRIKTLPTLALVKDAKTRDYIVGFSDLGNTDEFSTEVPAFFYQLKLGGSGRISLAQNFQTQTVLKTGDCGTIFFPRWVSLKS